MKPLVKPAGVSLISILSWFSELCSVGQDDFFVWINLKSGDRTTRQETHEELRGELSSLQACKNTAGWSTWQDHQGSRDTDWKKSFTAFSSSDSYLPGDRVHNSFSTQRSELLSSESPQTLLCAWANMGVHENADASGAWDAALYLTGWWRFWTIM